jgi:hypothetical protein
VEKSNVSMEVKQCDVCGEEYVAGILIDKRLKKSLERKTLTGRGICPEHQELLDKGFIALIGIISSKSDTNGKTMTHENAHRSGELIFLKEEVAREMFDIQIQKIMHVDEKVIEYLKTVNRING